MWVPNDANKLKLMILEASKDTSVNSEPYASMLDYIIEIFESQGLGIDYYGYHNIIHELEVVYVALIAIKGNKSDAFSELELKYLYMAAILHDLEPQKNSDKPLENGVIEFIFENHKINQLVKDAGLDINIIASLILRTIYPFSDENRIRAEREIEICHDRAGLDTVQRIRTMWMGEFLSVLDRIAGYALGPFAKALEMAKMNSHALGWHPYVIAQRSVLYFEHLLNEETAMTKRVLESLPREMRRSFMDNVLEFFKLRRGEIQIQSEYLYENLTLNPYIENHKTLSDPKFADDLESIYKELPRPLQISQHTFKETIKDPEFIINTLRIGNRNGKIIGFAKGGALERYQLRPEIQDKNRGSGNTIFLEPIALKTGYWGLGGGSSMRNMFSMQAHSKHYRYLTSFALREVIQKRINAYEGAEFVTKFDPERWDYYRVEI